MEPSCAIGLPHHRTIVALDIEMSTSRTDPVKAELRGKLYELFDAALRSAGIQRRHRDRFIDRGDGILALILVVSGDIYRSIVRHGYDGIDQHAYHPIVRVQIAGNRYPGWIHISEKTVQHRVAELANYRRPA